MSELRDPAAVARATGCNIDNVVKALPCILEALDAQKILQTPVVVGALATVAVECAFKPVEEAFWLSPGARDRYFDGTKYGKKDPVTGQRYYGRGFIQLTWAANYREYGWRLGLDLINHPELCLQYHTASRILALYFKEHGIDDACSAGDWRAVRKRVNGGYNGWGMFIGYVNKLLPLGKETA